MKAITSNNNYVEMIRGQVMYSDGEDGRVYLKESNLPNPSQEEQYPSTTTIEEIIEDDVKEERINNWRKKFDDPDEVLKWYQARGEIAHEKTYEYIAEEFDDLEYETELEVAEEKLDQLNLNSFPFADDEEYVDYAWESGKWSAKMMAEKLLEDIKEIIHIEQYVINEEIGYAGQFDLLYLSKDNELVLTDLKTASNIHDDFRIQLSAYYNALPRQQIIEGVEDQYDVEVTSFDCQIMRCNYERNQLHYERCSQWSATPEQYYTLFQEGVELFRKTKLPIIEYYFDIHSK
jgi:hypothetical protein